MRNVKFNPNIPEKLCSRTTQSWIVRDSVLQPQQQMFTLKWADLYLIQTWAIAKMIVGLCDRQRFTKLGFGSQFTV